MKEAITVIFGSTGGIGSCLAKNLTSEGRKLLLCSKNAEKLQQQASELGQSFMVCDATEEEQVKNVFTRIQDQIIGVVNCIGSFCIKPIQMTSAEEWRHVFDVNASTSFYIIKHAVGKMASYKEGSIVCISSCAAQTGLVHHEAIAAAKAAVEGLVRSAAASYAKSRIRLNAIAPGLVDTPLSSLITSNKNALTTSVSFHPMGRIGSAEDIAEVICFLLSKKSSWMTGQILSVDGGLSRLKTL